MKRYGVAEALWVWLLLVVGVLVCPLAAADLLVNPHPDPRVLPLLLVCLLLLARLAYRSRGRW